MASGRPKISIVNTTGSFAYANRIWQLDENNVFQLLQTMTFSSFASDDGGSNSIQSKFVRDSDYLVLSYVNGAGSLVHTIYDAVSFATKETFTVVTYDPPYRFLRYIQAFTDAFKHYMTHKGNTGLQLYLRELSARTATYSVSETAVNPPFAAATWTKYVRVSKTAKYAFRGRDNARGITTSAFAYRTSDNNTKAWVWSSEIALTLDNSASAAFSPDEKNLYHGSSTGIFTIYETTATGVNLIGTLSLGSSIKSIAVHPNGKFVAIGFGTTTINMYSRVGNTLTFLYSISNAGNMLQWSEDGSLLFDLGLAKAYTFNKTDGTYVDVSSTMMANVATYVAQTAIVGDVSTHINSNTRYGQVYAEGLSLVTGGTLDSDTYKAIFLNNSYSFSASDTYASLASKTLAEVDVDVSTSVSGSKLSINTTQAAYVSSGAVEAGGIAIYSVTSGKLFTYYDLADSLILASGDTVRLMSGTLATVE